MRLVKDKEEKAKKGGGKPAKKGKKGVEWDDEE